MKTAFFSISFLLVITLGHAQTGITIGPPRVYFAINPGQSQTEKIMVSNPSTDYTLELGVSFEDWEYSATGDNLTYSPGTLPSSCVGWVTLPEAFFSLKPGESKELDIQMSVPANYRNDTVPVHTAMMYVTQLNPRDGVDKDGANIQIAVRTGIKLYRRPANRQVPDIEIVNFTKQQDSARNWLTLHFDNVGKIWADGSISMELLNQSTGQKHELPVIDFYSMPGDKRRQHILLPADLEKGNFIATAIVNYGDVTTVKIAELEFRNE